MKKLMVAFGVLSLLTLSAQARADGLTVAYSTGSDAPQIDVQAAASVPAISIIQPAQVIAVPQYRDYHAMRAHERYEERKARELRERRMAEHRKWEREHQRDHDRDRDGREIR